MSALQVTGEDPVELQGSLDTATDLQLVHDTDVLSDYDQTIHASHVDLNESTGVIRLQLSDFVDGDSWQMNASHLEGTTTVNWSRGTDHCFHDFGPMTSELEIDVTTTSDANPPATKQRGILIKTLPTEPQPDHRPR